MNDLDPEVEFLIRGGEVAGFARRRTFRVVESPNFGRGSEVGGRYAAET